MNQKISKKENRFFAFLLAISSIFFFQEYFYMIIPDHKPLWIPGSFQAEPAPIGIPLTILGIIGLIIFFLWEYFRGRKGVIE